MTARIVVLLGAGLLAACSTHRPAPVTGNGILNRPGAEGDNAADHEPPFVRNAYAPFSRADAVAIALREWRLFGMTVDDDPPESRPPTPLADKPERFPGLWQRVGEYWWIGQDSSSRTAAWTGKHDENGTEFSNDGRYAWSAAFISYIMRIDGAGDRFPYSPTHSDYINAARQVSLGQVSGGQPGSAVSAEPPDAYAPQLGDLICLSRGKGRPLTFADLPTADAFPGHCDMVVGVTPGQLSVVGGNVDDSVTMKHVPVTADGKLSPPGGPAVDARYPWFVVLRVLYDR